MAGRKIKSYASLPNNAKPIPNYPTYYATPNGEIWRQSPPKITGFGLIKPRIIKLAQQSLSTGYLQVQPFVESKRKVRYVHRLVALTFKGKCPEGYECHHIDDNPANNHIDNLEWIPKLKNVWYANQKPKSTYKSGRKKHVNVKSKYKEIKPLILELRKKGKKAREISLELGIPIEGVYYCR